MITLADGTYTLEKNETISNPIQVTGTVTLDLAGHSITPAEGYNDDYDYLVAVKRGGNLTITDSDGDGKIDASGNEKVYTAVKMTINGESANGETAKLTVEEGTLIGYYYGIFGNGNRHNTEITINGGTITGECTGDNLGIYHPQNGTLTINDGTIKGYSSGIEMRDGTLIVNGGTIESTAESWGGVKEVAGGSTTVGAGIALVPYSQRSIEATLKGGTIKGVRAVVATANDKVDGVTETDGSVDLTVKGSAKIEGTTHGLCVWNGAKAKVSGNAKISGIGNSSYGIQILGLGAESTETTDLIINGGTITSKGNFVVLGNGSSDRSNTNIEINGGTITSDDDVAIYHPQDGKLKITGGTITGTSGVYIKSGDVAITGGTITGTTKNDFSANGNGANGTGAAVVIENADNYAEIEKIAISDGTFISAEGATPIQSENSSIAEGVAALTGFVSGGNFSTAVDKDVLDDSLTVQLVADKGNAPYSYYSSVKAATKAAQKTGGTITYEENGESQTIVVEKSSSDSSSSKNNTTKKYSVSLAEDIKNGTLKLSRTAAKKGATVAITVTPDEGYTLQKLIVLDKNGKEVETEKQADGKYTFKMPKNGVSVDAKFAKSGESLSTDKEQTTIILTIGQKLAQVNGEYVVNDVAPVLKNDRTMLPIRFIAEELGAKVAWNEAEQQVTITKDELVIVLYIGQSFAMVNHMPVELDAPAFIEDGRTYLPLRFVAENLGATVTWNGTTQQVTIIG